jgi:hypothetical protein
MAYLDGEVTPDAAVGIESHLSSCALCQRTVRDLKAASAELERWRIEDPPPSLHLPKSTVRRGSWLAMLRVRPAMAWSLAGGIGAIGLAMIVFTRPAPMPAAYVDSVAKPQVTPVSPRQAAGGYGGSGGGINRGSGGGIERGIRGGRVAGIGESAPPAPAQPTDGPMIARWATIRIVAKRFDDVRPAIDRILRDAKGFAGRIDATAARGASRTLNATLRVPAPALDATLASIKQLGQVVSESQGGDDVTEQVVDVTARLANARHTESRLTQVLRERTGKVSDVLEAEREIARVREQIERLDADRTNLDRRVTYATVTLEITEEPKAAIDMGPLPVPARLRNAFVDGIRLAVENVLGLSLTLLNVIPTLALWTGLLFFPVRFIIRRAWARG